MVRNDLLRQRKAQPGPVGFGGEKGFEDSVYNIGFDTRAAVGDFNAAGAGAMGGANCELTPIRHCLPTVANHIQHCLSQLPWMLLAMATSLLPKILL